MTHTQYRLIVLWCAKDNKPQRARWMALSLGTFMCTSDQEGFHVPIIVRCFPISSSAIWCCICCHHSPEVKTDSQLQCTLHYIMCICVFQTTLQQLTSGWGSYFRWWSLFSTRMGVLSSVYRWVLSPALIPVGLLCITYHRSTKLMNNIPHLLFLCFVRWRMNMAVISLVTTTTCVTFPSCSGLTWATTWCSSPQMELGSATSSAAQYRMFTPLLTLGQVGVSVVIFSTLCHVLGQSEVTRKSQTCTQTLFVWILPGGNVTAAFESQRYAEPHGPLASISLDMDLHRLWSSELPYIFSQLLLKFPAVFTGELWILHRLAGPLGVTSLCRVFCHSRQVPQRDAGHGSKRQHVRVLVSMTR